MCLVTQPSSSPSLYPTLQPSSLLSANPTSRPSTEEFPTAIIVDESNSKKSPNAASGTILIIASSLLALVGMLIAFLCYKKGYLQFDKPKDADDDVLPVHEHEMVLAQDLPGPGNMNAVDLTDDFMGSNDIGTGLDDFDQPNPMKTQPVTQSMTDGVGRRQITF